MDERKKRFPTEARRIEKEKAQRKERKEKEEKRKVAQEARYLKKQEKAKNRDAQDAMTKAKLKVEKLRRQLKKEKRRAAEAEAKASKIRPAESNEKDVAQEKKRKRSVSVGSSENANDSHVLIKTEPLNAKDGMAKTEMMEATAIAPMDEKKDLHVPSTLDLRGQQDEEAIAVPDPLTPTSQPALSEQESEIKPNAPPVSASPRTTTKTILAENDHCSRPALDADLHSEHSSDMSMSTSSSELSFSSDEDSDEGEDATSSDGSLSTDSSDEEEGPETATSARTKPDKVPPPAKRGTKLSSSVCRDWLRNGRCQRRHRCKWRHELVERGKGDPRTKGLSRSQRKSLHQRVTVKS